ncbi:PIN domain-containing protein [Umezawaea sp. NPDC059074]|uniref:PIN domain-containing protein n=1 Tax=Umezawaea sp. NPDC059074 TaxID=3346716 RepID=UPI0036A056CE
MAERLILDTGVLIAAERGITNLEAVIGDDDPVIAGISVAELLVGIDRSTGERRDFRALHTEALLAVMPIESYSIEVARMHALLQCHVRKKGSPRGTFDLIIAATAVANGRTLVTTDASANFSDLPGLRVRVVGGG